MNTALLKAILFLFLSVAISGASAQLLSVDNPFPTDNSSITITVDVTKGNRGLVNANGDVYVHTGVITDKSTGIGNWRHVKFDQNFNQPNAALKATSLGNGKFSFTINNIRAYYGVPAADTIKRIAILFRNDNGSLVQRNTDGSDMYIRIYDAAPAAKFILPPTQPMYNETFETIDKKQGDLLAVNYVSNVASTISLYYNGGLIQSVGAAQSLAANIPLTSTGNQQIVGVTSSALKTISDTIRFYITPAVTVAPLPPGVRDGINYLANDSSVILVLFAPGKKNIMVVGDFNDWSPTTHQMNTTADGKYFWLQINNLKPGTEYAYQYLIDGTLKVADYYTEKVLDPDRDRDISNTTYPNLKAYPTGKTTGIVSVLQTKATAYEWKGAGFSRPDKRNLLIYELLVRDFVAAHDFKTVKDSLNYLKNLGINALELMPVTEFEGNSSWGYNTSFYFAPDKYYGPKNRLKELIDSCHSKGIAVIIDMVLNHSFGQSPMVQMYFEGGKPAANSPWFNVNTPHAFGFGYDFNHESEATKYFVDRVVDFWLTEYKVDGFRFDFTKGFTQKPSSNDAAFSAYDQSRVDILKRINNYIKSKSADAYVILEHLAANDEEKVLAAEGMMLWGNMNYNFNQATMGYSTDWNFSGAVHTSRQFSQPLLVSYMESHDEERTMFKNIKYGNASTLYKIKGDTITSLARNEMTSAFYLSIPGPKMIWQFGELGYDISRCYLSNNGEGGDCNTKLDEKPIRWDYLQQPARKKLYDVHAKLMKLRKDFPNPFISGNINYDLASAFKIFQLTHTDLSIAVIGNFDVNATSGSVTFSNAGTWYNYLNGETITATGVAQTINLAPGEYRYYVNKNLNGSIPTGVQDIRANNYLFNMKVYPSPGKANTIQFQLPHQGNVLLELVNVYGQPVSTLSLGMKPQGSYTISMSSFKNLSASRPGVYFVRLSLDRKTGYTKFVMN